MDVDKLLANIQKRHKYLFFRFTVLTLMILFTYKPMLSEVDVTHIYILNATIFLIGPLFVEYLWGMQAYNKFTNSSRIFGIVYTFLILFCSVVGLMGGFSITNGEGTIISNSSVNDLVVNINYLRIIIFVTPALLFFDFIFTLSSKEISLYKLEDEIRGLTIERIKEMPNGKLKTVLKKEYKEELLGIINGTGGEKS